MICAYPRCKDPAVANLTCPAWHTMPLTLCGKHLFDSCVNLFRATRWRPFAGVDPRSKYMPTTDPAGEPFLTAAALAVLGET